MDLPAYFWRGRWGQKRREGRQVTHLVATLLKSRRNHWKWNLRGKGFITWQIEKNLLTYYMEQ